MVTGGASGMGRSICEQFAARGHRVAVFDVNAEAADAVADDLRDRGGQALAFAVDVADRASVDDAVGAVRREFGPVELLVTSAGISMFEPFLEITLESWNRIIEVNLTGTFHEDAGPRVRALRDHGEQHPAIGHRDADAAPGPGRRVSPVERGDGEDGPARSTRYR